MCFREEELDIKASKTWNVKERGTKAGCVSLFLKFLLVVVKD